MGTKPRFETKSLPCAAVSTTKQKTKQTNGKKKNKRKKKIIFFPPGRKRMSHSGSAAAKEKALLSCAGSTGRPARENPQQTATNNGEGGTGGWIMGRRFNNSLLCLQ